MLYRFLKITTVQLVICFSVPLSTSAQTTLWESVPINNINPYYGFRVMYYDSVEDVSYIAGEVAGMFGDSCVVYKWDGSNYTLLPPSPMHNIGSIIRYKDKIYFGGSPALGKSAMTYWDGNQ